MRKKELQQLAQHVQLYESQDRHHKRQNLGRKIEVTGGHAHQRECHQYCGRRSHNYHTGAIRFRHLRTLLSAVLPVPRPARFPFGRVIR